MNIFSPSNFLACHADDPLRLMPYAECKRLYPRDREGCIFRLAQEDLPRPMVVFHNGMGLRNRDLIPDFNHDASAAHDLSGALGLYSIELARRVQEQLSLDVGGWLGTLAATSTWPWAIWQVATMRQGDRASLAHARWCALRKALLTTEAPDHE